MEAVMSDAIFLAAGVAMFVVLGAYATLLRRA
jgi:hypothetical protein